ncbi:methyltransferase [Microbacterium sp. STN6]|uniref:DUF7059 domain-containing protein n=1 Tax=Microbacterium sp. STN6 TaxID=2995588 RepID=UPI002260C60F|nr:methyltransferase [Microbacterium sp. STN6]MCX7522159.1 methyltransferase [Microbacterium sp. STN6]
MTLRDVHADAPLLARLADDLRAARFTVDGLAELWGAEAGAALHRGRRLPAVRALEAARDGHGRLGSRAALAALFVLGIAVDRVEAEAALASLGVDGAAELGLLTLSEGSSVAAALDLRPYAFTDAAGSAEWWVASDLGELALGRAIETGHVLGIGGASTTLAGLLMPTPVRTALDLGTGCGIQAMHARRFAERVVATDISARALTIARFNARLNGIDGIELRAGSLFEPVAGDRFDRIVSNPPFVITPRVAGVPAYEYRDGGMTGDQLVERVLREAADHLNPGGVAQLLANWEYHPGEPGLDRVRGWLGASGLDAWVIERELMDAPTYAETWIRDGGTRDDAPEFERLYAAWLDDFEARGVESVGFGYVTLRRPVAAEQGPPARAAEGGASARLQRYERLHGALGGHDAGLGAHIEAALAAHDWLAARDDDALGRATLAVAPDVTEHRHYWPGSDDPTVIELRQGGGFGRTVDADTALAALVGACDGELTVQAIVAALADLLEADASALRDALLPRVRDLVAWGILTP